jgi:hypothetical protein
MSEINFFRKLVFEGGLTDDEYSVIARNEVVTLTAPHENGPVRYYFTATEARQLAHMLVEAAEASERR